MLLETLFTSESKGHRSDSQDIYIPWTISCVWAKAVVLAWVTGNLPFGSWLSATEDWDVNACLPCFAYLLPKNIFMMQVRTHGMFLILMLSLWRVPPFPLGNDREREVCGDAFVVIIEQLPARCSPARLCVHSKESNQRDPCIFREFQKQCCKVAEQVKHCILRVPQFPSRFQMAVPYLPLMLPTIVNKNCAQKVCFLPTYLM